MAARLIADFSSSSGKGVGGTQLVRAAAAVPAQQRVNKFEFVTPDNRLQVQEKEKEKKDFEFIIDCNVKSDRTCFLSQKTRCSTIWRLRRTTMCRTKSSVFFFDFIFYFVFGRRLTL